MAHNSNVIQFSCKLSPVIAYGFLHHFRYDHIIRKYNPSPSIQLQLISSNKHFRNFSPFETLSNYFPQSFKPFYICPPENLFLTSYKFYCN